jgi:ferredoxin, 2Fe-2S
VSNTKDKPTGHVKILPDGIEVTIRGESCLLHIFKKNHIDISHVCGGFASCGTCRVHVESNLNDLPPREGLELEMAEDRGFQEYERLSCQLNPYDGLVVSIPKNKKGTNK